MGEAFDGVIVVGKRCNLVIMERDTLIDSFNKFGQNTSILVDLIG